MTASPAAAVLAEIQAQYTDWDCSRGISSMYHAHNQGTGQRVLAEDPVDLRDVKEPAWYDHVGVFLFFALVPLAPLLALRVDAKRWLEVPQAADAETRYANLLLFASAVWLLGFQLTAVGAAMTLY